MIDTIKITVTTPTVTPRIVNAERSLFARSVSMAIMADSFVSASLISQEQSAGAGGRSRKEYRTDMSYRPYIFPAPASYLFRPQGLNRIKLGSAPGGPEPADHAYDRRNAHPEHCRGRANQ